MLCRLSQDNGIQGGFVVASNYMPTFSSLYTLQAWPFYALTDALVQFSL